MKNIFTVIMGSLMTFSALSQSTLDGVKYIPGDYAQKISQDGTIVLGETISAMVTYDMKSGEETLYYDCYFGNGNCISKDGLIVGSGYIESLVDFRAVLMKDGQINQIPAFNNSIFCALEGINQDGTRICGIVSNPNLENPDIFDPTFNHMLYVPVYCDMDEEGNFTTFNYLPVPDKDFFGGSPQYCTAVWISNDGKTIAGQVCDNTGMFLYPIIYTQNEEGWNYSLPSENLFNPDNLNVSEFPEFTLKTPDPVDYIENPEERERYLADVEAWMEAGSVEADNPLNILEDYTTEELADAYWDYYIEYQEARDYYNDVTLTEYYENIEKIRTTSIFFAQNAMAMNQEGTILAITGIKTIGEGWEMQDIYTPYLFDLITGEYKVYDREGDNLVTRQVLADGTVIASAIPQRVGNSGTIVPARSSILLPGAADFISMEEYIASRNSSYADWMKEHLSLEIAGENEPFIASGLCCFNDDMSVMVSGVQIYSPLSDGPRDEFGHPETFFTYIFTDMEEAGIKGISSLDDGIIRVYNLQGVSILKTREKDDLKSLAPGIYIINGKKTIISSR